VNIEDEIGCCSIGVFDCSECCGTSVRDECSGAGVTVALSISIGSEKPGYVLAAREEDHL